MNGEVGSLDPKFELEENSSCKFGRKISLYSVYSVR